MGCVMSIRVKAVVAGFLAMAGSFTAQAGNPGEPKANAADKKNNKPQTEQTMPTMDEISRRMIDEAKAQGKTVTIMPSNRQAKMPTVEQVKKATEIKFRLVQ